MVTISGDTNKNIFVATVDYWIKSIKQQQKKVGQQQQQLTKKLVIKQFGKVKIKKIQRRFQMTIALAIITSKQTRIKNLEMISILYAKLLKKTRTLFHTN